jgi:hypothetical protein
MNDLIDYRKLHPLASAAAGLTEALLIANESSRPPDPGITLRLHAVIEDVLQLSRLHRSVDADLADVRRQLRPRFAATADTVR